MNPYFLFPLTAVVANILLFSYILIKSNDNKINRVYSYFTLSLAIWALGDMIVFVSNSASLAYFWRHIPLIGACFTSVFLLHFLLLFTKNRLIHNKILLFIVYLPAFIFIFISFTTTWISQGAELTWWGYNLVRGPLYIPYTICFIAFYVILGLLLCIRYYFNIKNLEKKIQIKFLILAILIPLVGGILTQIIPLLIGVKIIPMTSILTTFTALIIAYAILKHELMTTKFFSVYNKLVASFLIIVLLVVIIGVFSLIQSRESLEETIGESSIVTVNNAMEKIDATIINRIQDFQYQTDSQNTGFHELINESNKEFDLIGTDQDINDYILKMDEEWMSSSSNITSFIEDMLDNPISNKLNRNIDFYKDRFDYELFGEIFVTNKYGANIGLTQITSDYYQADEEWWMKGKENGVYIGDVEFDNSSAIYSTTIAIRIDDEKDNFVGMFKAVWNIQEIISILSDAEGLMGQDFYKSRTTHLLEGSGRLIYSTDDFEFLEDRSDWLSIFHKSDVASYFILHDETYQENEKLIAFDYSSVLDQYGPHDWVLAIDYDTAEIYAPVYDLRDMMVLSIIVVSIIGLVVSYVLSRMISKPIIKLRDVTKQISKGRLDANVSIDSNDEIGDLSKSFQHMMLELEKSRDQLEDYNRNLEKMIQERTVELALSKKEIAKKNVNLKIAHDKLAEINKNLEQIVEKRTSTIEDLLKQKNDFINLLGHDLKNPLGPILNLSQLLEKKESDADKKKILKVISRNAGYMKNLVTNTLELARLNSPNISFKFEPLVLKEEVDKVIQNNKHILDEKDTSVINNVDDDLIVHADSLRLEELITNILNNSVKYSDEKGRISIDTIQLDNEIQVAIHDDGIGMTEDQLNQLFNEFYKADESRHDFESSGLGMPIAKRIVEKHGGRIWAESEGLGMGSTFYFTLPAGIDEI